MKLNIDDIFKNVIRLDYRQKTWSPTIIFAYLTMNTDNQSQTTKPIEQLYIYFRSRLALKFFAAFQFSHTFLLIFF